MVASNGKGRKTTGNNGNGWKPGQSGNPNGRPKFALSDMIREVMEEDDPDRKVKKKRLLAERIVRTGISGEDRDSTQAIEKIIRAVEGDKLNVNPDWEPEEWEMPEDDEPIPAPRWADPVSRKQG